MTSQLLVFNLCDNLKFLGTEWYVVRLSGHHVTCIFSNLLPSLHMQKGYQRFIYWVENWECKHRVFVFASLLLPCYWRIWISGTIVSYFISFSVDLAILSYFCVIFMAGQGLWCYLGFGSRFHGEVYAAMPSILSGFISNESMDVNFEFLIDKLLLQDMYGQLQGSYYDIWICMGS